MARRGRASSDRGLHLLRPWPMQKHSLEERRGLGMPGSMQRVWARAKEDAGVASEGPRGTLVVLCLCLREILEGLAVCTVAACSKGESVWWLSTLGRRAEWTRDYSAHGSSQQPSSHPGSASLLQPRVLYPCSLSLL